MTRDDASERDAGQGDFAFHEYLLVLRQRWKLIALLASIGIVYGLVQYQITPRMYRATTVLQIEQRYQVPRNDAFGNLYAAANWWNVEYYPTQYELLKSRGMAERVITDLRLTEDTFFNPAGARRSAAGEGGAESADARALAGMANRLKAGLTVAEIRKTQLAKLSYRSANPEFATKVVNGYADAYIGWGIEERSGTAERGSAFLASEIETLKQEIQDKESQLQALTLNSEAIVLDAEGSSMIEGQIASLNSSYSDAVRSRVEREAKYRQLLQAPRETVANTESDGLVQELRRELSTIESQYESQLKTYKPEWPSMVELRSKIDNDRQQLAATIDEMFEKARQSANAEYQAALRQEQSLRNEMSRLRGEALNQNVEAVEIANLRAEIQTRRDHLEQFYQAQSATEATARFQQTKESNVRIVDRALVPGQPYQPNLTKSLAGGLGGGLVAGILLAFLLHYLDRTIKTGEQAERVMGLPVLAVIADVRSRASSYGYGPYSYSYGSEQKKGRRGRGRRPGSEDDNAAERDIELLPNRHPKTAVSEAYRSLRAALLMSTANELKVVSMTSAESGEGKSSTLVNIAVVMAQLGKRVLLVDGDLRRPRLHQIFQLSNRAGLVACLTSGLDVASAAQSTDVPNLDAMPSGPIPPNPSELLASPRMAEIAEEMRRHYDLVLIDSPPVLAVSDPIHSGAVSDGVIFCIAANSTPKEHCQAARDRLLLAEVKILGVVLNRYDSSHKGYGKRYEYYYQYYSSHDEAADSAA